MTLASTDRGGVDQEAGVHVAVAVAGGLLVPVPGRQECRSQSGPAMALQSASRAAQAAILHPEASLAAPEAVQDDAPAVESERVRARLAAQEAQRRPQPTPVPPDRLHRRRVRAAHQRQVQGETHHGRHQPRRHPDHPGGCADVQCAAPTPGDRVIVPASGDRVLITATGGTGGGEVVVEAGDAPYSAVVQGPLTVAVPTT